MHLLSFHHVHCICMCVHLMHSSIFPVVHFAFWRFVLLWWSFLAFFRVWGLNISGLDRDLPSGLGLLPADRLSSFVSFGLRLILQRLSEGPKRPRVCCSPTPLPSCALHLHVCSSHAFEHFSRCPFCILALRSPLVVISSFLSCVGIKHFWIGPRLAKRPWFTTGRPPVKFRIIWTSFDTPTVIRGTKKASCVLQPNTPPSWPRSPPVVISTFLSCVGIKHFWIDRDLPSSLGLPPVDRLSSFVSFGLRLILQRLTKGPKRPRMCCSPTPLQFGPKPT